MTIPTRAVLSSLMTNLCYFGVDTFIAYRSEVKAPAHIPRRSFTTISTKPKSTPIAYPLLHGFGKDYYLLKTLEKVAFITETLCTIDEFSFALKCSMDVSLSGVSNDLKNAINLTSIIKNEVDAEFDDLWEKRGKMTQHEFLQVLYYNVRTKLIYKKGLVVFRAHMEFVKTR